MEAKGSDVVAQLVRDFEEGRERIHAKDYKEANVRQDFLDPLFAALGWNTADSREVQHERAVRMGDETKSVDVAFRLSNRVAFVLEAKRPSIKILGSAEFAYQARRYGWNAGVPFAILTNFGETSVYDTTARPREADSAQVALVESWAADEFVQRWPILQSRFSKTAVQAGSLEEWSTKVRGKQNRIRVDESLLADIEEWRLKLAKTIIAKNDLESHQLAETVQLLLDRVLFLRICEDRGLESPRRLAGLLEGGKVYDRLKRLLQLADQRYNAGLFYLEAEKGRGTPDAVSASLIVDDDVLKEVIHGLYDKNKPYNFAVIPTEILGQVYEQFLGTVLRITASGDRVKAEFKPEVKEAGGVFYTPAYIVTEIVKQTIGPLLEGKSPDEVTTLKILDPACGSGSFLLGAYQFLLNWYREWYVGDGVKKHALQVVELLPGRWVLTVEERKRILRNHIYGVDIDRQATEVTKLSLFLKVVEETAGGALDANQKLVEKRVLPSLEGNIKCGNTLVEPSHVPQQSFDAESLQTARRVNAFSWQREFPQAMSKGGFDAIIGNPPYIRVQALNRFAPLEVELYKEHYSSATRGNYDIYVAFVERGLQLLGPRGRLGYIVPHKFFNAQYGEPLRSLLAAGANLQSVVHFGDEQVFEGAITYTCLLFLTKERNDETEVVVVEDLQAWRDKPRQEPTRVPTTQFGRADWNLLSGDARVLFEKIRARGKPLGDLGVSTFQGIITGVDAVFVLEVRNGAYFSRALQKTVDVEPALLRPLLKGLEIARYEEPAPRYVVIYPYQIAGGNATLLSEKELRSRFPCTMDYLTECASSLKTRDRAKKGTTPQAFGRTQNIVEMGLPKIILQVLAKRPSFTIDEAGRFAFVGGGTAGGHGIIIEDTTLPAKFLLGLLNSGVLDFYHKQIATPFAGGFFAYSKQYLMQLPIAVPDPADPVGRKRMVRMEELVEAMLRLHRQKAAANSAEDKGLIQRQIDETDEGIETLVGDLYGLTPQDRNFLSQFAVSPS
jgi:type I restriction-modification system DNA methylase subunit